MNTTYFQELNKIKYKTVYVNMLEVFLCQMQGASRSRSRPTQSHRISRLCVVLVRWYTPFHTHRRECAKYENGVLKTLVSKWKSGFFTCPCYIHLEGRGSWLFLSIYTSKITIFVSMWNMDQFREKLYNVNNQLISSIKLKWFCTICDIYHYLPHSTFRFYLLSSFSSFRYRQLCLLNSPLFNINS